MVTSARIDSEALSGAQIDQAVRDAVLDGSSLYAVDAALIRELDPDLVITQDLCRVCAVSTDEVRRIEALDCDVLALDPHTIAEVEDSVHTVAGRLGRPELAAPVVAGMRDTIGSAAAAVDGLPRRRVFLAEWHDPPFASGHWLPEMVALAGGADVLGEAGAPSRPVTWDDVDAADPELVIVAPCGFDAARAARETPAARRSPDGLRRRERLLLPAGPADRRRRRTAGAPAAPRGRSRPGDAGDQARVNRATHSMWCVCGNMSTGWTRSSR